MLINKTQIKEVAKSYGVNNMGKDVPEELSKLVEEIIKKACNRAIENDRTTLMSRDL